MGLRKTTSKRKTPKADRCILVLWGDYFDETAATVFVVSLRQAGLCVRVVGVDGLIAAGRNGLALHADLSLSEINSLCKNISCLILPCSRAAVNRLENDPRIHELFRCAAHCGAKFVVHDKGVVTHSILHSLALPYHDIATYAQVENLVAFVKELAIFLVHRAEGASAYSPALPSPQPA